MKNKSVTYGPSLTSMLAVTFITLKLTEVIDWSWWWVLSPIWIPIVLMAVLFSIVAAGVAMKDSSKS